MIPTELFKRMGEFSEVTFPKATSSDHLRKLKHEADEAISKPDDIEEYADCLLALFGAAYRQGFTLNDLLTAANIKMDINDKREWKELPDGTFQHIN